MRRPRIKWAHRPKKLSNGHIRLGGNVYGLAVEIADPEDWLWNLLVMLDGTRTTDEVRRSFPDLPPATISAALDQLLASGHVEDAAEPVPSALSAREIERYQRGRALFSWMDLRPGQASWQAQVSLSRARVTVVGLGGTGGGATTALVASGVGRLHLIEPDRVELSNLNRQVLYTERDLGRAKVEAALEHLRARNSDIALSGERRRIDGPREFAELMRDCDLLVLAADRPAEIRMWANHAALETGTAWCFGGYQGPKVSVGLFDPATPGCYDCFQSHTAEPQEPLATWPGPPVAADEHPVNAVSAGMSGLLLAHLAIRRLTDVPQLPVNQMYVTNLVTLDQSYALSSGGQRSDCPSCVQPPQPQASIPDRAAR